MKKHILLSLTALCTFSACTTSQGFFKDVFDVAVQVARETGGAAAAAATNEFVKQYGGEYSSQSESITRDFMNYVGVNSKNVERGLAYVNAADKYQVQNVLVDYGLEKLGEATNQQQLTGRLNEFYQAYGNYMSDNLHATTKEEQQAALDRRNQSWGYAMADTYLEAKDAKAKHLAEKTRMARRLTAMGYDPVAAQDFAGSIIAISKSKDLSQEEKDAYIRGFGFDLSAQEVYAMAVGQDNSAADQERLRQEEQAREQERLKQEEEARLKREREAKLQAMDRVRSAKVNEYAFDKTDLTAAQQIELDGVAAVLAQYPDLKVKLVGHTCDIGSTRTNERVGLRRAEAARDYLVEHGVEASRITAESMGETAPAAEGRSNEARKANRRIEIIVNE